MEVAAKSVAAVGAGASSSSSFAPTASGSRVFFFFFSASPRRTFSGRHCFYSSSLFRFPAKLSVEGGKDRQRLLVVSASKKRKNKPDSHSFVVKPDEATGLYPEAVLLKKKTVKEDGRVLPEFADAEEEQLYEFLSLQLESDLNLERMRHYEVVYLIHEDHIDDVEGVINKVQDFVREKKGRIWRLNNWGLRRLAYKINKAKNANYILMNFEIDAKYINDFKTMLDKDERIIRHLVMKQDEAITEDCPPPPEFHTMRQQGMVDEEASDEDEDWDSEMELEMASQDNIEDDNDNVIIIDGAEVAGVKARSG